LSTAAGTALNGSDRLAKNLLWLGLLIALIALPFIAGDYYINFTSQILIAVIFAASLNLLVGYAGLPSARNHNTMTFGATGQGVETQHDVWRSMDYASLDGIRISEAAISGGRARIVADLAAAYPKTAGVTG